MYITDIMHIPLWCFGLDENDEKIEIEQSINLNDYTDNDLYSIKEDWEGIWVTEWKA